jgi:hypothetical protein
MSLTIKAEYKVDDTEKIIGNASVILEGTASRRCAILALASLAGKLLSSAQAAAEEYSAAPEMADEIMAYFMCASETEPTEQIHAVKEINPPLK